MHQFSSYYQWRSLRRKCSDDNARKWSINFARKIIIGIFNSCFNDHLQILLVTNRLQKSLKFNAILLSKRTKPIRASHSDYIDSFNIDFTYLTLFELLHIFFDVHLFYYTKGKLWLDNRVGYYVARNLSKAVKRNTINFMEMSHKLLELFLDNLETKCQFRQHNTLKYYH